MMLMMICACALPGNDATALIPEPGTFSLLGLAGVALVFSRRRRR